MGGNPTFHEIPPSINVVGGVPCETARGKSFTKPFNLTLAVTFLTSDFNLLPHVRKLEISKKVVLFPKGPPNSFRGEFQISAAYVHISLTF